LLALRVLQAEFGDCLILEFGSAAAPRYILVDGGPPSNYEKHLRAELLALGQSGCSLQLVIASHVDNDHVIGLLDLFTELLDQKVNDKPKIIEVEGLWHNSFARTIGNGTDVEPRLRTLFANSNSANSIMANAGNAFLGIGEGQHLRLTATQLGVPINRGFDRDLVAPEDAPQAIALGNLTLQVVGPTEKSLGQLQKEWLDWLDKHEDAIASADPYLAEKVDRSTPNLSSIMVLAQADSKKILLTGDGRGDHLVQGLGQAGLLDSNGSLHVDLLKMPHHGSVRNVTQDFLRTVTADTYVISANGRDGNPDLAVLIWLVEAAREQQRPITIFVTNETLSTQKLVQEYRPDEYGYTLKLLGPDTNALRFELVP
jgi:Metallo-beta-lactamase superfamily